MKLDTALVGGWIAGQGRWGRRALNRERGRKALGLGKWEGLNSDRLRHEIIFTATGTVAHDNVEKAAQLLDGD